MAAKSSFAKQLFNKDDKYFRKYIENTTAHGVVRIFSGKSYIRRLFWLVIVLGATAGCLNNVINRIIFFAGSPTSTTLALTRQDNLTFPAVTVCNLNQFRQDVLNALHPDFAETLRHVFYSDSLDVNETQECSAGVAEFVQRANLHNLTLESLYYTARDPYDDFINACYFSGKRCNESDFTTVLTDIGYCYTFNLREPLLKAVSTGTKAGLFLALNIQQPQYVASSSLDAGVKVVVHQHIEAPRPDDNGIAVPPGRNAFIGIREKRVTDNTKRQCQTSFDTSNFNFLEDEAIYSVSSCGYDCLLTSIAEKCQCTLFPKTTNERFKRLPECTLMNICCVLEQQRLTIDCQCPASCDFTVYDIFNSYSAYPAQYAAEDFESFFSHFNYSINTKENYLSVNVYFESLNVETQTTSDAYGPVALLSDIGGQLGLFMGVSVISIMEFVTWIADEVKHRLFGDRLSGKNLCSCRPCKKAVSKKELESSKTVIIEDKELTSIAYTAN